MPRRLLYLHGTPEGVFALPLVALGRFAPLPSGWLLPKVSIHVGPYRISWQWECLSHPRNTPQPEPGKLPDLVEKGTAKQRWELDIFVDGHRVGRYELSRILTLVGRHPPSHLMMMSRSVSGCHCVIVAEEDRLWAVDLCSGNGIRLGGQSATAGLWPPEVPLQLGRVTLVPRMLRSPASASSPSTSQEKSLSRVDVEELTLPWGQQGLDGARDQIIPPTQNGNKFGAAPDGISSSNTPVVEIHQGKHPGAETVPTFFDSSRAVKNRAFDDGSLESTWTRPDGSPSGRFASELSTGTDSDVVTDRGGVSSITRAASLVGPYDSLGVQHEFAQPGCHPELVGTEIIVEEGMQDNHLSAQAKDYVLCLFADESVNAPQSSLATEEPDKRLETLPIPEPGTALPSLGPEDGSAVGRAPFDHESFEKKSQELIFKEQLLAAWARTLDEMSEAILKLQEELVAEEDRFAEQQQLLAEQEKRLLVWQTELEQRADNLNALQRELERQRREFQEKEQSLREHQEALARQEQSLAAEAQRIRALLQDSEGRAEKLTAEQALLERREEELREKHQAILEQEASLKHRAEELAEREKTLLAIQSELEKRASALDSREQDFARREKKESEKLAEREASLKQAQQAIFHREHDLKKRSDELALLEQTLLRHKLELEEKERRLLEQDQLLASRTQELAFQNQRIAEAENRIVLQRTELDNWQMRLQQWEEELRHRESNLVTTPMPAIAPVDHTPSETMNPVLVEKPEPAQFVVHQHPKMESAALGEECAQSVSAAVVTGEPGREAESPAPAVRFRKARTTEEWPVIPLARVHRRWRWSPAYVAGLCTALLAACAVWWFFPREFLTACRLEFQETSPLLYARDGTWPRGLSSEHSPSVRPVAANHPEVIKRLQQDERIRKLFSLEERPLDQVLASAGISRSEGLPFTTLSLSPHRPEIAQPVLETWGRLYVGFLAESFQQRASLALARAKAEWQDKSQQLTELQNQIARLKQQHDLENARQFEFRASESMQMADLTQKEIEQLNAEIKVQTERLEQARVAAKNPEQLLTEVEVMAALAERLQKEGLTADESQPNQGAANSDQNKDDGSQSQGNQTTNGANVAGPETSGTDKSRYEMLRELVRKELLERKRQDATLAVQVLDAELERLQARLQMTVAKKSEYENSANTLKQSARELNRLEVEEQTLHSRCQQLETEIETLEKALAESKMPPRLEVWWTQQRPWMPFAFAALAGGITMIPFGLWWFIRSRRVMTFFPPSVFENASECPQVETV